MIKLTKAKSLILISVVTSLASAGFSISALKADRSNIPIKQPNMPEKVVSTSQNNLLNSDMSDSVLNSTIIDSEADYSQITGREVVRINQVDEPTVIPKEAPGNNVNTNIGSDRPMNETTANSNATRANSRPENNTTTAEDLTVSNSSATNEGNSVASNYPIDKSSIVAVHNQARQNVGVTPLAWSEQLATSSARYANTLATSCRLVHEPGISYGENLYYVTRSPVPKTFNSAAASRAWLAEIDDYNYANNSCVPGKMCGHYTQMVWDNSTQVGCAQSLCNRSDNDTFELIQVCRYNPPGNYVGQKPY